MKVTDLIKELQEMEKAGHGEDGVIIDAFGGLCCNIVPITGVSCGFDWTSGNVCLHPAVGLWTYDKDKKRKDLEPPTESTR